MYINTFKYTPADVDCKLCTEYVKKFGCTACGCPWMAERIEAGVDGLERLFDLLRDDGLIHPAVHRGSAERDGGDRAAGDERGAANARRTHHLYGDGAQARPAQLPGRIGRERGEFFAAVHGLAQERELLLQGLDLLFASHI